MSLSDRALHVAALDQIVHPLGPRQGAGASDRLAHDAERRIGGFQTAGVGDAGVGGRCEREGQCERGDAYLYDPLIPANAGTQIV
jgi:hypothetical protein